MARGRVCPRDITLGRKVDGAGLTEAVELPALNDPSQTTLSDWGF
jgi:hypothetical protein